MLLFILEIAYIDMALWKYKLPISANLGIPPFPYANSLAIINLPSKTLLSGNTYFPLPLN